LANPDEPKRAENLPALHPSPAARERVVTELTRHFSQDEITQAELELRLDRAYRATTMVELNALVADIESKSTARAPASTGVGDATQTTKIRALLSAQERNLSGAVPRRMDVRSRFGYVSLDFRDAVFQPGVTEIDVSAFCGYVEIHLPANVLVESEGNAFAGYFAVQGTGAASTPFVVRITGRATAGYVEAFIHQG
jgi:hypothetical protein